MLKITCDNVIKRSFTGSQVVKKQKSFEEKPVIKYIGKHHKRAKRIYLWGDATTGALGRDVDSLSINKFSLDETVTVCALWVLYVFLNETTLQSRQPCGQFLS